MTQPAPDPARWLADLMKAENTVLWPAGGIEDMSREMSKALAAASAPWTKAVADLTALQMTTFQQLAAPWLAALPGASELAENLAKNTAAATEKLTGPITDRRFAGEAWTSDPRFEAVARTYLAQTDALFAALEATPLDERSKAQWRFALRQIADAASPANALATNPEAIQTAIDTGGKSLVEGARLFTEDLAAGRVSMTDPTAFEVGHNVGTTPGSVVHQNELIQLLQYTPTTGKVYKRPLVVVPPCINKYYILDLQPANSFVAHAVAEGHTVFLVSWRNVGPEQGERTWDDYLTDGVLQAIDVAREITGSDQVNTLGFCVGGTLLASALAVAAARDEHPAASMTLLTTLLDFSDTGEIGLMVTPEGVAAREASIGGGGLLKGSELAQVFASLRANDLIWPYVVQGYLKGKPPPAFDLLFWNSDDTNLPGPMFCWYLRNTYLENKLREPGATTQCGVPVDLGAIRAPTFVYASQQDHIVPWRSAYNSIPVLSGAETTFVLGASGHIAGVINPPAKNKRNYWTVGETEISDADGWFDAAEKVPGSWWPAWYSWLAPHGGAKINARKKLGSAEHPPIEDAPGAYVKQKAP